MENGGIDTGVANSSHVSIAMPSDEIDNHVDTPVGAQMVSHVKNTTPGPYGRIQKRMVTHHSDS